MTAAVRETLPAPVAVVAYESACDAIDAWRLALPYSRRVLVSCWPLRGEPDEWRAFATERSGFAGEGRGVSREAAYVALAAMLAAPAMAVAS